MNEKEERSPDEKSVPIDKDYLQILSHQLKSPINAIESLLSVIVEGLTGGVNSQTKQVVEKALKRADDAREVISDLLDLQMYSMGDGVGRQEYDVLSVLRELGNRYSSTASEKNVSLRSALPSGENVFVTGDHRAMNQALRNLIENAVKYTPTNGNVSIRFTVTEDREKCRIEISDTGYGIPREELDYIFEPFFRSFKHKSNIPGTGLGLAIVKKIINAHGGEVSVESKPEEGSTFTVILPVARIDYLDGPEEIGTRVVIVGGVTAGPKTAARLRRLNESLDITLIERNKFLSYAGCGLPSYINGTVESSKDLMTTADATVRDINFFQSIQKINILNDTSAEEIDRTKKVVSVVETMNNSSSEVPYDYLVLATGAKPNIPDIPGINSQGVYTLHSLENAEVIKNVLSGSDVQDVYIIGAGLVGISITEALIQTGKRVTILEKRRNILVHMFDFDFAKKIENELKRKGIKIITGVEMTKIEETASGLNIHTSDRTFQGDVMIIATGVRPNSELARKAGLEIGSSGGIKVNTRLQTSDENIYAIGDCAESINLISGKHEYWPLGSISTKMGRIAADNIAGIPTEFEGSLGTTLFRLIDVNLACTGLTERDAFKNGFDTLTAVTVGLDRAHYLESAEDIFIKVIADRKSQMILGAQMFGKGDISTRIGVFALAISRKLTLDEFFKVDLGYAPAFNSPIDIIQTGCLVLKNKLDKLVRTISVEDFDARKVEYKGIISVCPFAVYSRFFIPDSISIPLENLRFSSIPFEKDDGIVLYSRTSSGAYIAYRYLISQGYSKVMVLEGGYEFWSR